MFDFVGGLIGGEIKIIKLTAMTFADNFLTVTVNFST
mgnify:CR=1 FL=1|tara:strand:+ start:6872 stop:6982 length:111 start_codon:yes stop_codon:yes gene_type:complete